MNLLGQLRTLSELNRKEVYVVLEIYNVFPGLEGIEEPESLHDALTKDKDLNLDIIPANKT